MVEAILLFSWKRVAAGLLVVGLILTAVGAGIAASGVILTEKQATELASTKWDLNVELRDALLDQSTTAMWGLIFILIGTVMQLAGVIIPLVEGYSMNGAPSSGRRLEAVTGSYSVTGIDARLTHETIKKAVKYNWPWVALYAAVTVGGIVFSYCTSGWFSVALSIFVAVIVVGYLMLQKVITITRDTH